MVSKSKCTLILAIVVHLGTMIGGHYVAYTLVDPDRMFQEGEAVVEAVRNLNIAPSPAKKRVWCYCSE
jgi:ubiquitin carboxyl-terminal hydrolase 16/45